MRLLKPSLTREFNQYVPLEVSSTLTVIVFIVSTVLHLVFMYVYHRYNLRDRILPESSTRKNAIKPVLHVPNECSPTVSAKLSKRHHFLPSNGETLAEVNLKSKHQTFSPREAASSSSVASQRCYDNVHVTEISEYQQEELYATIEKKEETPA